MKRLQEYRAAAFEYLGSRIDYFTDPVDAFLDGALRDVSKLPLKPDNHDSYNGILGMKPVMQQRKLCLQLLLQRLSKFQDVQQSDLIVDTCIRVLNTLPARADGINPYERLFNLPAEKEVNDTYKSATDFKVSNTGIELIHSFESYRECTYKDPGAKDGLPITGGWGSTRLFGKPLQLGKCYPKETWDAQFDKDLDYFEYNVKKYVKVPITQGMYDSLVSWVYNCGIGVLVTSTAIRRLNSKNYVGAAEAMTWYNKGGDGKILAGLVRRRQTEYDMFLS